MRSKPKTKYRPVLMALATVFAISVVGVSTASAALPEFFPPTKNTFTGGTTAIKITDGFGDSCTAGKVTGEIGGAKLLSHVVFSGWVCSANFCYTKGEPIKTEELSGRIGYLVKSEKKVGLLLESTTSKWWKCLISRSIVGSVIGRITPVNKTTNKFTISYETLTEKQKFKAFEGEEATHQLEVLFEEPGEPHKSFGLEGTVTVTTAKFVDIEA
jgi:hypothetical protein